MRLSWLLLNAAGIGFFLTLASWVWMEPELADIQVAGIGEAVTWFTTAFPVFLLFMLLHVIAVWRFVVAWRRQVLWWALVAVTFGSWIAAFRFDVAHH